MSEFDKSVSEKIDLLKRQLLKLMPEPTVLKIAACKLTMAHLQHPTSPRCSIYNPLALLILQGKKHSVLRSEEMEYGAGQYMVTNLDIPSTCHVSEASPEKPYLALYIELDSGICRFAARNSFTEINGRRSPRNGGCRSRNAFAGRVFAADGTGGKG